MGLPGRPPNKLSADDVDAALALAPAPQHSDLPVLSASAWGLPASPDELALSPTDHQKDLAVKLKRYLDYAMAREIAATGKLSLETRQWASLYTDLTGNLHRSLNGEKTLNLHVHRIDPRGLAAAIRGEALTPAEVLARVKDPEDSA